VKERFEATAAIAPDQVESAQTHRRAIAARLDALLDPGNVLYLPTAPRVAPPRRSTGSRSASPW
jgi:Asp-tRNA(Asn)/Glu-tRNA(Gln) amidotransferase A subunit family amidase